MLRWAGCIPTAIQRQICYNPQIVNKTKGQVTLMWHNCKRKSVNTFVRCEMAFNNTLLQLAWKNRDCSYFGLLVEVGSVLCKDLRNSHFVLLCCQMEGRQTTLHEEHIHTHSYYMHSSHIHTTFCPLSLFYRLTQLIRVTMCNTVAVIAVNDRWKPH